MAEYRVAERPTPLKRPDVPKVERPADVYHICKAIGRFRQEVIRTLLLNGQHYLIRRVTVVRGGLNAASVEPREVFRPAILASAAGLIFVHSHPSGDATPSDDDIRLTRRLIDAGELLGIPVLDNVVVSRNGFYSLHEYGRL